jgi:hypothetical protein
MIIKPQGKTTFRHPINSHYFKADPNEEVIFDACRDNNGKGVSIDSVINILKKILDR